ncbi:MAG TPA: recombinase family protein [Nostoc sp.]|uniref:recombinase family protein n=1 Tax=Nostoc sp. TaxID=1180 RepID=UPI002D5BF6F4|nr:recombinase family protein [Nostoc sp.]HYX16608.1 recombinase family protein [Nostoc sp.]
MLEPNKKGIIAGYIRVSTDEQAEGTALNQQMGRIKQDGVDEIYSDIESGANSQRPNFQRLINDIISGKISTIKATRWDRLTRNQNDFPVFKKIIQDNNVQVILLDQGQQDFNTAAGELSADLQVLFAAYERNMLRERVKHGHAHRRKQLLAASRAPLFYEIVNNRYFLSEQPIICSLLDRPENYLEYNESTPNSECLMGQSKKDIALEVLEYFCRYSKYRKVLSKIHERYSLEKLDNPTLKPGLALFSTSRGLKEWLRNPVLRGHTAYLKTKGRGKHKTPDEWEIHLDTHPQYRLLTDEEYQEIEVIIESNSKKFGQTDATFYLTGLIFCNKCKSRCTLKAGGKYKYYGCQHANICCENNKSTRISKIEQAIISALWNRAHLLASTNNDHNSLKSDKLIRLEKRLKSIENIPDFEDDEELLIIAHKLRQEIKQERNNNKTIFQEMLLLPQARKINFWYTLTEEARERFYEIFVDKVFIDAENIMVVLKL